METIEPESIDTQTQELICEFAQVQDMSKPECSQVHQQSTKNSLMFVNVISLENCVKGRCYAFLPGVMNLKYVCRSIAGDIS